MPVIFISYRREDSAGHAGRLFDRLRERFGRDHVFLDVVGIDAGVDFVDTLDKAVGSCDVLLAVIGREWLTCCDKQGRRRLDDPNDFIRAEISVALKRDVRVVPVLVQGAEMPPTDALPEELKRLTRRQAVELRDSRWDSDVEALIATLEKQATRPATALPPPAAPPAVRAEPAGPDEGRKPDRRVLLWGIVAIAAALIAVGVALSLRSPGEPKLPPAGSSQELGQPEPTPTGGPQDDEQTGETQPVNTPDLVGLATPPPAPRIEVPDVVGADSGQATETLLNAGFEITRRSEPVEGASPNKVLRQEPAPGSRAEKGARVTLVYSGGVPDRAGQAIIFIGYPDKADQRTAEGLESYLRGLRLQGTDYETLLADWGSVGKLFYPLEEQADLAKKIASRSSSWLSSTYNRKVLIEAELDTSSIEGMMMLYMPGPR
ncbi:MAG TPA: TIR domain-containing protein [Thermoanaerobaculia bacterium]|nr:TIR domain-containing protein [Thermoanaerobaculia bacterium]